MNKKVILASAFLGLFFAGFAFAVPATEVTQSKEALKQKIAERKAAAKLKQCEVVDAKLSGKVEKFQTNNERRIKSFNKTADKLERFISKMEDKGYVVETLKADIVTYKDLIEKYKVDYAVYIALLRDTKQFTCTKTESEFKAKLEAARDQLKIVHQDSVEIRTFYAKTFRPHLLELKKQEKTIESENENDDTETEEGTNE